MDRLRKAGTNKVGDQAPADEDHELPLGSPDIWGNGNNGFVQPSIGVQGFTLQAAHRLMASDKTQALRDFVGTLSTAQKEYFFSGLPVGLDSWFVGTYDRNLRTPDIVLSSHEVVAWGINEFKRFIIGMSHIRTLFPPRITSGSVYRLTATPHLPEGPVVKFKPEEQFRSLTSWTTRENPKVESRERISNTSDIVLQHKLNGGKNVLFDYDSLPEFINTLLADAKFYQGNSKANAKLMNRWKMVASDIEDFRYEKEVAIYVNAGSELSCTWREE